MNGSQDGLFEILQDFDLPYGDYRSGSEDPALKGISVAQCQAKCLEERQCTAYTYNVRYQFCFLKEGTQSPLAFEGAISGRKLAEGGLTASDDTSGGLVGAPNGCPAQAAVVERLRRSASVSVSNATVAVGPDGRIPVAWETGAFPERLPVYLIVSTSSVVRFEGTGFYALTPSAEAAFDV